MIKLIDHHKPILDFLTSALRRFRDDHRQVPVRHVALYCCPWSGWISLCLDSSLQEDQNCPEFEFVEFDLYEDKSWVTEYEADIPKVMTVDGTVHDVDIESEGDEALNRLFYDFLVGLLSTTDAESIVDSIIGRPVRLGVQLLDSQYETTWDI